MIEPAPVPATGTDDILRLLELEMLDDDLYRNRVNDSNLRGVLYGGQVLSQALNAAIQTVDATRTVHSLHGYFLRPGDVQRPVVYHVERTRDGGTFSTRRISAVQHQKPIFHMEASFHVAEAGFDHEVGWSEAPPAPEDLMNLTQLGALYADRFDSDVGRRLLSYKILEVRPTDPERQLLVRNPSARSSMWVRMASAAGATPNLQACALTYASDSWLAPVTRIPHFPAVQLSGLQVASLDHAMWFHRPCRMDEWHLYEVQSPWTGAGRGLARGSLYDRDGRLVASTMQEALLRRAKMK
jgi:acyl-CoA thioesterase II